MNCCWIHESITCGNPADLWSNLPLCGDHIVVTATRRGATARQAARYHPLEAFPGVCYFLLMPDGLVKIGYSNSEEKFAKRIKSLSRGAGAPAILLGKIPGGFVAEAVMHDRFVTSRVPGTGERFTYTPEMAKFIASIGA